PPGHSPQTGPPPEPLPTRPWHSSSFWVVITLAVILGVVTLLRMPDPAQNLRPQPSRSRVTLAVRQFRNLNDTSSNDTSSQDFVAVGLTEEMVTHLGQLVSATNVRHSADAWLRGGHPRPSRQRHPRRLRARRKHPPDREPDDDQCPAGAG